MGERNGEKNVCAHLEKLSDTKPFFRQMKEGRSVFEIFLRDLNTKKEGQLVNESRSVWYLT